MERMSNDNYESLVIKSTTGEVQKSSSNRNMKINSDRFTKSIIGLSLGCVTIGTIDKDRFNIIKKTITDNNIVKNDIDEFNEEVINKNTYRSEDKMNYFFDYDSISKRIKTDQDIYLLYKNIGLDNTNKVLELTNYNSLDSFISNNNYQDIDEFLTTTKNVIVMEKEIVNKQNKIDEMLMAPSINNQNNYKLGGK